MNIFDIITAIFAVIAIYGGWRNGLVSQLLSIGGIVIGVLLAAKYGAEVGEFLKMEEKYARIAGFVVIFLATLIASALLSKLLGTLFSAVGLGVINTLLGIALSLLKYGIVLSVIYVIIFHANEALQLFDKELFDASTTFNPVRKISDYALEYFNAFKEAAL